MIDLTALLQPDIGQDAREILCLAADEFDAWLLDQPKALRSIISAAQFKARSGEMVILPRDTSDWSVVAGAPEADDVWGLAAIAARLPAGTYRLSGWDATQGVLGWLLAHDRFDAYKSKADPIDHRVLITSSPALIDETIALAEATIKVRALVNTPAADMGPEALETEVRALAKQQNAEIRVTHGDALEIGFPMIHAVGKAAARSHAPRLIELTWGNPSHPRVAIVGKGVCFDSGGLDIKPSSGMRLMKKDMGGAAHAIALAGLIMKRRLPVQLHLLIPAVENAIAGNAFRPGDILKSRQGMTVEVDNTDAEGRLVLADALTKADEDGAELIIDFATLTGAARVALGPDLPAMFSNDDDLAHQLLAAGQEVGDPCWQMPLWSGYSDMLKSDIADTMNSSESGFGGAVTAALFLQKFVRNDLKWAHFDTFSWRPSAKPGRPKGGEALGLRATFKALQTIYTA